MESLDNKTMKKKRSIKKDRGNHKTKSKKKNYNNYKSFSNSNLKQNKNTKIYHEKDIKSNNLSIIDPDYKIKLFNKIYEFLNKKKFKLSNNFDAKNSKKFLAKKDKCLERIILPDLIETKDNSDENSKKLNKKNLFDNLDKKKKKLKSQSNMNNYFIVISNYDEDLKNKSLSKKSVYRVKTTYND